MRHIELNEKTVEYLCRLEAEIERLKAENARLRQACDAALTEFFGWHSQPFPESVRQVMKELRLAINASAKAEGVGK